MAGTTLTLIAQTDGRPPDVGTAVGACFFVFSAGQSTTGRLISTGLRNSAEWNSPPRHRF
ncbi:hypothetical protein [Streptomyces sp. MZ04]|uniref:hypothetical protein n=1 Tax=Streptomyces sp. MZ04 TaxID=2559236 RepID=UPI00107EA2EE|nr:hypothetical protein [Streptomyces sp. MZ04]TGB06991.1 hypothetical protein E2651_22575 [Streptomyces sp. MZ04]